MQHRIDTVKKNIKNRLINSKTIVISLMGLVLLMGFNNCAKVSSTAVTDISSSSSSSPLSSVAGENLVEKTTSSVISPNYGRVDIVLVVDDSKSMQQDSLNLASRLSGFVADLEASQIDWQMCLITTNLNLDKGNPMNWVGNPNNDKQIINKGIAGLASIFTNTVSSIQFGRSYSGDERGIAALYRNIEKMNEHNCYRKGAGLATIIISDEDERSFGGNSVIANGSSTFLPLEAIDQPDNLLTLAKSVLGSNDHLLKIVSNSIILRSGDSACSKIQNAQGSPAFPGTKYEELSIKTSGNIGSICTNDFTTTLKDIAGQIKKSLVSVALECPPVKGIVDVQFNPNPGIKYHIENQSLIIDSEVNLSTNIVVRYKCEKQ